MKPWVKRSLLAGAVLAVPAALLVAGFFSYVLFRGPHMKSQPHLRAYEAVMPLPPEGSVPVERRGTPSDEETEGHTTTEGRENRRQGEIYYRYYCLFCHGEAGDGHGPVGQSYMPVPADLRSARFRVYTDERLLRAMVTGIGHEPVLDRVVPQRDRQALLTYLRSLGSE